MITRSDLRSQSTFDHLCSTLDYSKESGLISEISDTDDDYIKFIWEELKRKLKIDAIFFLKTPENGPKVPLIYFKLMESRDPSAIAELHKLSWNIGVAPLLFIILPDSILIYNNLEPPAGVSGDPKKLDDRAGLIDELKIFSHVDGEIKKLMEYKRLELATGNYWRKNMNRFNARNNVFFKLLHNLCDMRNILIQKGLQDNIVDGLLVRSIFIKYLEDRRDGNGQGAFPDGLFGQFRPGAVSYVDLLSDKKSTYGFFKHLSDKFNGDIFKLEKDEEDQVAQKHLDQLRRMLTGKEYVQTQQTVLWPLYSFDVIPIELISNIYEQFFRLKTETEEISQIGIHYTPYYLVAFLVNQMLPFSDTNTNVRIIDPACGSGIFLVESYRRLILRWMKSHGTKPSFRDLLGLLKENIFGVDIDEKAIRIAALSLHLTLCEFLEPRSIWNNVRFERLIGENLFHRDSFDENTSFSGRNFDLVIGNPPWESKLSPDADKYLQKRSRIIGDKQICQAFLHRAADLCKIDGNICMIVSSKALLFNISPKNMQFRETFFSEYRVKRIINLSALRHRLFSNAVGPGAVVIYSPEKPDIDEKIFYCSPKPSYTFQDNLLFMIEPEDIAEIPYEEALGTANRLNIWKISMWGSPRDFKLLTKLSEMPTLEEVARSHGWKHAEGFIRGSKGPPSKELIGMKYIGAKDLRKFTMNDQGLQDFKDSNLYRSSKKNRDVFKAPHLLIKQSPAVGEGFIAAVIPFDAVFPQSIMGIHGEKNQVNDLISVCQAINSKVSLYYAMMTSSRWLVERDELAKKEIMKFPIPQTILGRDIDFDFLKKLGDNNYLKKEEQKIMLTYGLSKSDLIMIEDMVEYTLDYFRRKEKSKSIRTAGNDEIQEFLSTLCDNLNRSFSKSEKMFKGKLYSTNGPLRLVSLDLVSHHNHEQSTIEMEPNERVMDDILNDLDKHLIEEQSESVFVRRHLRRYGSGSIQIIKPNQKRYWTRSSAIKDSDKIYREIMESWRTGSATDKSLIHTAYNG